MPVRVDDDADDEPEVPTDIALILRVLTPDELKIEQHLAMLRQRRDLEGSPVGEWECPGCSWTADAPGQCPKCNTSLRPMAIMNANAALEARRAERRAAAVAALARKDS